jgi:hypothetical protein
VISMPAISNNGELYEEDGAMGLINVVSVWLGLCIHIAVLFALFAGAFFGLEVVSRVESIEGGRSGALRGFDDGFRVASCKSEMGEGAEGEKGEGQEATGAREKGQRRSCEAAGSHRNRAADSPNGRIRCCSCCMFSISALQCAAISVYIVLSALRLCEDGF